MIQLIINHNDIYQIDNISYFKFTFGNKNFRDIQCDLSKVDKYMLEIICEYCQLNFKGLKKKQLVDLITNYNCLIMNQN
jgi:hypothetical protein